MTWMFLILAATIGLLAYIRLAPSDPARWHVSVSDTQDANGEGWARRVIKAQDGMLSKLNQMMLKLPRTKLLAGSVDEGRLTYVTRSKLIGFPDYTTIEEVEGDIRLYARLRFGRSDFGVNGKRLDGVLAQIKE